MTSKAFPVITAATMATAILRLQNPDVIVSGRSIQALLDAGALPDLKEVTVRRFFQGIHVLTGSGKEVVRVSLLPLRGAPPTDLRPYGIRKHAGVDFRNALGLNKAERRDAWTGVWPLAPRTLAYAARDSLPIIGVVRGYVGPKQARIVTGSALDLTTGYHWVETRKLNDEEREELFPGGATGAWVMVGRGAISALEEL